MASTQAQSAPAAVTPDIPMHNSQPVHTQSSSTRPVEDEANDLQTTEASQSKSLFGPFQPTIDPDQGNQQKDTTFESKTTPTPLSPDQIEPTNESQQVARPPSRNLSAHGQEPPNPVPTQKSSSPENPSLPPLVREKTAPAIGPATDKPTPVPKELAAEGPALYITLLLSSTGARHPYRLDEKYLKKRNVIVDGNNPINISLYKLKELILRDWREEWEAKPTSPESIRLISMGKMLNDKARLADSGFTNGITPHIIHMTIKPQEMVDEEDAKMKAGGGSRGEDERTPGCRCIIQ